jgi:hypothetical protein
MVLHLIFDKFIAQPPPRFTEKALIKKSVKKREGKGQEVAARPAVRRGSNHPAPVYFLGNGPCCHCCCCCYFLARCKDGEMTALTVEM